MGILGLGEAGKVEMIAGIFSVRGGACQRSERAAGGAASGSCHPRACRWDV